MHDILERVTSSSVVRDCLDHPRVAQDLYDLALNVLLAVRKIWLGNTRPDFLLSSSASRLEVFTPVLKNLRKVAQRNRASFGSEGFGLLFDELIREVDHGYLDTVDAQLRMLQFPDGALQRPGSAVVNKGTNHVLRHPAEDDRSWLRRRISPVRSGGTFVVADRDIAGMNALRDLRGRGISVVADVVSQSADHVHNFLLTVQREAGLLPRLHQRSPGAAGA